MAKRRKLEAPSAADMDKIEAEFRRETRGPSAVAPIAQVAGDAAQSLDLGTPEDRATRARDEKQAEDFRAASGAGRLILDLPLEEIEALSLQRDRTVLDKAALEELEYSININGVRLPIEVYPLEDQTSDKRYGLLSGYRRLIAQRNVFGRTGNDKLARIRAVVRDPNEMGGAFAAMVEENEIRQDLSHFERGRIAVIAAQSGAFHNVEEAVNQMFPAASKAKRSKIRSFAMIFEELGDMLSFPENLREKDGLKLAQGLRNGAENRLREVLGTGQGTDAKSEWALIEAVLEEQSAGPRDPARGGRPKLKVPPAGWAGDDVLHTSTGVTMRRESDSDGFVIRFSGRGVNLDLMEMLMLDIRQKLEKP